MMAALRQILRSRRLSQLLLLLASCLLAQGFWIEGKAWLAQALIATAWNVTASETDNIRPWPWADTWPVARLEVPRMGVRRYILAGVSGRTLAFGPGWATQTALPGSLGASLIAGHRDTHFHFLKGLRQGDRLLLHTPGDKRVIYRVTATGVVSQRQSRLISDQEQRELLLVTCYPFDTLHPGGELRYVVWAEAESRQTFGLESIAKQTIISTLNEADTNIPPSGLSASRLSG
ncbi:MAG: class GN sortase [Candidatus Thiodiazotropha sp.]